MEISNRRPIGKYKGGKKMERDNNKNKKGFFKELKDEIIDNIVFGWIYNIIMLIPRIIVSLIKSLI